VATTGMNHQPLVTTSKKSVLDVRQITTILFYRRFLIVGVSCVVMSATSLLAVITKPMYQSSMQIMVKDNLEPELSLNQIPSRTQYELNNPDISSAKANNQIKLMLSSKLVQKAVNLLRSDYPQITMEDIKGNSDTGKQASLIIKPTTEVPASNLVNSQVFIVSFKDPNPVKTKRVLQALQKVYQDYNSDQKNQRVQQGLDFVNHRIPNLQRQTLAAEKKLEIFRKKYNLINPQVQTKILLESLTDIQKQRQKTRSQQEYLQSRYNSLQQKLLEAKHNAQVAETLTRSSIYQALANEIRNTERILAQESLRYTDNSPVIIKLKEKQKLQIALLDKELKDQTINVNLNSKSSDSLGVDPELVNEISRLETERVSFVNKDKELAKAEKNIRLQINNLPNLITEYNRLLEEVRIQKRAFEQLVELQQTLGVKIAQSGFDLQILEEPDLGIYIGNKKWLLIISGVLLGPIIGVIVALVWEMFNRAIFSPLEFQKLTNIRLIGSVPKLGKSSLKSRLKELLRYQRQKKISTDTEKNNQLSSNENLDMIYQNLQIFKNALPFKSLMLTSALPGEGKTTLALGLGSSAANMHQKVLVIDGNLRSPNLHKVLGISNDWGLSLLLLDDIKTQLKNYLQPIHPSIDVLTAGPKPDDVVNLLSSEKLKELMETCAKIYDLVIIDTSSVLDSVDARIIASVADGIVMVGRIGKLSPQELMQTTEILSQLNLIGIVANDVKEGIGDR
jgi:capsular exopolysaccharide synthesis family protein